MLGVTFFSWTKVNSRSVRLEISSSYLWGETFFSSVVELGVWLTSLEGSRCLLDLHAL